MQEAGRAQVLTPTLLGTGFILLLRREGKNVGPCPAIWRFDLCAGVLAVLVSFLFVFAANASFSPNRMVVFGTKGANAFSSFACSSLGVDILTARVSPFFAKKLSRALLLIGVCTLFVTFKSLAECGVRFETFR